jgi:hypothetical protein
MCSPPPFGDPVFFRAGRAGKNGSSFQIGVSKADAERSASALLLDLNTPPILA